MKRHRVAKESKKKVHVRKAGGRRKHHSSKLKVKA
jgi:hypothetical protein